MSDGYRDDGTGTEDWGVTRITEQVAAWPSVPSSTLDNQQFYRRMSAAYSQRLRTTAEALRAFVDSRRESGWAIAAGKNAGPALNKALPDARAVLAQLEKEGLA